MGFDYSHEIESLLGEPLESVLDRERNSFDRMIGPLNSRFVLFGAGSLGRRCLASLRRAGLEPLAFSDNNPQLWNKIIEGLEVLPPEVAASRFGGSALFVVTIWHVGHSYRDTARQLQGLCCRHVTPFSPLRWRFAEDLLPDYCLDVPHKVILDSSEVRAAADGWADDESRLEFLAHLRWRLLGDHLALRPPSRFESYFPEDLLTLTTHETFVDCGAYDGDTIRAFLARTGGLFQKLYSFEPDRQNYARLSAYIDGLDSAVARRVALSGAAVGSRACTVHFSAIGGEGSSVSDASPETVPCVSLDDALADAEPTFIKMDIEGFEREALLGARECIRRARPTLAICAYHRQSDLWRIPRLIQSLMPRSLLFLRIHESEGWQLVCYALPRERAMAA